MMSKYLILRIVLFLSFITSFSIKANAEFIDDLDVILIDDDIDNLAEESSSNKFFDPKISFELVTDVKFTDNYQNTDRKSEYKDTELKIRQYTKLAINKNLYIKGYFKLQREDSPSEKIRRNQLATGGGDRTFENLAVHLEELNLNYLVNNDLMIKVGKTDLDFGKAWNWRRGIWGYNLSKNYKQTEKLGLGGIYSIGDSGLNGRYHFGFFAFKDDSKYMDNSILTSRQSTAKSKNKPGDRSGLRSYVATLDIDFDFGEKYNEKETLKYSFAYIKKALRDRDSSNLDYLLEDEKGYSLGLNYILPIYNNLAIDGLYEFADIQNVGGNLNISEKYHTFSLITDIFRNYNLTLSSSWLYNKESFGYGFDQNLSEISAGYTFLDSSFFDKLKLQFGYKHQRVDLKYAVKKENSYGFLIRYIKNF